ncbi:hypothetical protein PspLS_08222 [Pyricularia sp. CBS 133598]|nr:hypothetical protein PspLS_08222 [Pyricularia sp. CBS 133598]
MHHIMFVEAARSGKHEAWPSCEKGRGDADREALQSAADDSQLGRLIQVKWQSKLVALNTTRLGVFENDKFLQTADT